MTRITDPQWNDYVLSQLESDETDDKKRPYAHGLRRLVELLIGPIITTEVQVIQPPQHDEETGRLKSPVVVLAKITIMRREDETLLTISDGADVHKKNIKDFFLDYSTATCITRAKARCYKEALRLKTVTADECGPRDFSYNQVEPQSEPEFIDEGQEALIRTMCQRLSIDIKTFASSFGKFTSLKAVPYQTAIEMCKKLTSYQRNPKTLD